MPHYRRWYEPGATYFFTVVTAGRWPLFNIPEAGLLLGKTMRDVRRDLPFQTPAIVLLPNHLHCLWTLPPGDEDFSGRWKAIKARFTRAWLISMGHETAISEAQSRRKYRGVWQGRFWEHVIRDEEDFDKHFDYIHFNPVRHGLVPHPVEWRWSSFHRHVRGGHYPDEWGRVEPQSTKGMMCE